MEILRNCKNTHQRKPLSPTDVLNLVSQKGLNACYFPYSLTKDEGYINAAYSDVVFISIDYYSKNRIDLAKKHLELVKSKTALFVGISTFYDQEVFKECIDIGINKFLFKPITEGDLLFELDEAFIRLKNEDKYSKNKSSFIDHNKVEMQLSNVRLDKIFSSSIAYIQSIQLISSDLFFRKRVNQHLYFIIGEGIRSSLSQSLLAADTVKKLDRYICENNCYSDSIFDTIERVISTPYEFVELDGKNFEMRYKGGGNAVFVRKNRVEELPQDTPVKVRYDDVVFLFSDGLQKQKGHKDIELGSNELRKFLLFLSRLKTEEMKKEIDIFLENWKNKRPQDDDISLLAFRI